MISRTQAAMIKAMHPAMTFEEFKQSGLSDGCTVVPDFDIRECCIRHDYDYIYQTVPRAEADRRFRQCIASKAAAAPWWKRPWYHSLAWAYWAGVRALGWGYYT